MTDLFALFSKLVTPQGEILIPGINEKVAPLTEEERKLYEAINVTVEDLEKNVGAKTLIHDNKVDALMGRMRYPSTSHSPSSLRRPFRLPRGTCEIDNGFAGLSIHGIEGAFSAPGAKTVIPASVKGGITIAGSLRGLTSATDVLTFFRGCAARFVRQILDPTRSRSHTRRSQRDCREVPSGTDALPFPSSIRPSSSAMRTIC